MRKIENADALVNGAYQAFNARVQLVVVPDITVEGAFDELVQGTKLIHLLFVGVEVSLGANSRLSLITLTQPFFIQDLIISLG